MTTRDALVEAIHQQARASRHLIVTVLQAIEAQSSEVLLAELVERGVLREMEGDKCGGECPGDFDHHRWEFCTMPDDRVYVRVLDTEEATDVR